MATPPDLYERIVAHLPQPALRESCNSLLRAEASGVGARLREVSEALRRLREVEAAVARLQRGGGDRRRSASLMALVAETARIQREMASKLERMPSGSPGASGGSRGNAKKAASTRVLRLNSQLGKLLSAKDDVATTTVSKPSSKRKQRDASSSSDSDASSDASESSDISVSSDDSEASETDESSDDSDPSDGGTSERPKTAQSIVETTKPVAEECKTALRSARAAENATVLDTVHVKLGESMSTAGDGQIESSDDSEDSSSESDGNPTSPSDWINELAWKVTEPEPAESHSSGERSVTTETAGVQQPKSLAPAEMLALAHHCLAKVKHSLATGSRKNAGEALRELIVGVWDGPKDALQSGSTKRVVSEAIICVTSSWTNSTMSFLELYQATKLAAMINRLCEAHPALRLFLNWGTTSAETIVSRNPKLHREVHPFLSLVLDYDSRLPAHRCDGLEKVTSSIEAAMSANLKTLGPLLLDQLALSLRLVVSWICTLPLELKTPNNLSVIRAFRDMVLKYVNSSQFSNEIYAAGVKKLMVKVGRALLEASMNQPKEITSEKPESSSTTTTNSTPESALQDTSAPCAKAKTPKAPAESDQLGLDALELMKTLRVLPSSTRADRVDELVEVIVNALRVRSESHVTKVAGRLTLPIKYAVAWIIDRPLAKAELERYRDFVRSVEIFASRVRNSGNSAGFNRMLQPLSNKINGVPPPEANAKPVRSGKYSKQRKQAISKK